MFNEQLKMERSDPIVIQFLLQKFAQLNMDDAVDGVLENIDKLQHVVDSVMRYLDSLRNLTVARKEEIGNKILAAATAETRSKYERVCLLSLFTKTREFDNEDAFEQLFNAYPDSQSQREIALALGRAGKAHWFMQRRQDQGAMEPWLRRAFLAAFSCVDVDSQRYYYRSLRGGADVLEGAIIKWVSANPYFAASP
jgi:hypothetical protein